MADTSRKPSSLWGEIQALDARLRQLKHEFDVAHEHAMSGLAVKDHDAFAEALERKSTIIDEQAELLRKIRELHQGKPSN